MVALVYQYYTGIVLCMSDGAAYGLVDCLHTEILIVDLSRQTSFCVPRLKEEYLWLLEQYCTKFHERS